MSIFTRNFKSTPLEFVKSHVIIVPEETDVAIAAKVALDPMASKIFRFELVRNDAARAFTLVPLRKPYEDDINTPSFQAYYLGWERGLAPYMELGDAASLFFTSHMTNCRMTITGLPGLTPRVSHVSGARPLEGPSTGNSTRADRDRYEAAGPFPDDTIMRARSFSISDSIERRPTRAMGSIPARPAVPKKHNYGGGNVSSSFFFGFRGLRTWEFWSQITPGDRSDATANVRPITILQCSNFMNISRERALRR